MASYTTSLRLVQPATGEYSGTWGTQVNNGLTALVDTSVAGTATITMVAADYTLSTANGATDEARAAILNVTGTPGAARNIIVPAVSKTYVVYNNTTGGFAQTVKTFAGTGISVPNGATAYLRCNGTDVVAALNYLGSLTLGAALPIASGGTGSTSTTYCSLTANVTGTLPVANGGTGSTSTTYCSLTTNVTGTLPVGNGGTGAATLTGILKGNGISAFSAATAGTDFVAPGTATTFTATQTFSGTSSALAMVLNDAAEVCTVSATAATGTINFDVTTQSVLYYTTNASANWVVNIRASAGTTLNTALSTGQSVTVAFLVTQGATPRYNTSVQIDGTTVGVTTKWSGGAPTAGTANGVDIYSYAVIKTGASTFNVFASRVSYT